MPEPETLETPMFDARIPGPTLRDDAEAYYQLIEGQERSRAAQQFASELRNEFKITLPENFEQEFWEGEGIRLQWMRSSEPRNRIEASFTCPCSKTHFQYVNTRTDLATFLHYLPLTGCNREGQGEDDSFDFRDQLGGL